ncbi:MAG: RagB/SusD family nutrient uptake outer membrane protein [Pseudopedobacter saltans]|uniref:RagB/SusD family nutrient uptake outer membrane protein n=1 Tax=Pseudopedobacter saltans TaxID=151895 RepID=A0A2W5F2K3_9SPHI|nr:MAG: RagB/SusD family nutrient uptake outer membrane protein [Pseudopedobacter saltans]
MWFNSKTIKTRKMKLKYSILACGLILFSSCKKFLDTDYNNRIRPTTTEQFAQVLVDGYPLRHDIFTDIMTDDYQYYARFVQAINNDRFLPLYLYSDEYVLNAVTGPEAAYAEFYAKIYTANVVIEGVMASDRGTQEYKSAVMGEALLLRAYCHFILVNLFGKHYDPATASTDLGVSIVTEVSKEDRLQPQRSSVQAVYDQIEKDVREGIADLENGGSYVSTNPYHFSKPSAYAFMERVQLYKGQWDSAVVYADKVIAEKGRIVRNLTSDLALIRSASIEYYATMFMDPGTHPSILLTCYGTSMSYVTATGYYSGGFYVSDVTRALYKNSGVIDRRDSILQSVGSVVDNQVICTKYATQPNNPGNNVVRSSYFTMEEVLLNRAEAILRGSGTLASAVLDLNALRSTRYVPYTPLTTALSRDSLLSITLSERRKEFLNEGLRWYDVKRLKLSVSHALGRYLDPVAVLEANDLRKQLQIPVNERLGNPNIQLNPR